MKQDISASTQEISLKRVYSNDLESVSDVVAIEAPLEIRLKSKKEIIGKAISVTMRTPGDDVLLAKGFLFTEGILTNHIDILACEITDENVVEVTIREEANPTLGKAERNFYTTSSCGVCGKSSIDAIKVKSRFSLEPALPKIDKSALFNLQSKVLELQSAFTQTGGIHAAALFTSSGELITLREDVGRHNATDKLIGECWGKGLLPLLDNILFLSGRASFELIQKATMAGIAVIVSVGAPSSLAIELAEERGHTLVGFLKENRFNIYCGHERIE
ncbi:formate dehydrogenase accessory sulfurtransferase FdhD [Roseivirga misakiensis]|uniref:Sulfur carrier protein FdhD n=1 Tax=Roseivirga misakiensis TaxID=1563681 RepID=A0A1E5T0G8_9BACT|nr:formate dehydrogenase accessory sulfurtransferase FdhD [Roseivirga misakiensis]OEK04878.1 formate dehydrogenase family accessory protein FdhD [Roseivirga misakiensis]